MWKKTCAPHTNITIVMPSGMNVHSSSSASEPWISTPTSSPCRRRNLTANTTTRMAMSAVKNAVTATRKKYRASTCPACSDAACGKNGKFVNIRLTTGPRLRRGMVAAAADEEECQERPHREDEPDANRVDHRRAVLPFRRVVVVAEQQDLVADRAELVVRRLDHRQPQVARREVDAEQVARDDALRRRDVDRGRVRELLQALVVGVVETDRRGERL